MSYKECLLILLGWPSKEFDRTFAQFEGLKLLLGLFQGLDRRRNGGLDSPMPRLMRFRVFGAVCGEWLGRPDPPLVGLKILWAWCPTLAFTFQPLAFPYCSLWLNAFFGVLSRIHS
jgi:hypothetical protein